MRIVSWDVFSFMSNGTLFAKYESMNFGELCIKDSTIFDSSGEPIDFDYIPLLQVDYNDSGEFIDIMTKAEEDDHFDIPLDNECGMRDGLFEHEQKYAVFGLNDINMLIRMLQQCV
jgi:hypothetical protein